MASIDSILILKIDKDRKVSNSDLFFLLLKVK